MQIEHVDPENLEPLKTFLAACGSSLETFRYFAKRPLSVVQNHLTTLLGFDEYHVPVAYGHLDQEDGKVWLGICVADGQRGKGYGNFMMQELMDVAREMRVQFINLTVGKANSGAIRLYEKYGFKMAEESGTTLWYLWSPGSVNSDSLCER